jgi:hypothetical protein
MPTGALSFNLNFQGGGVRINPAGTFIMLDGEISGNSAHYGGGVFNNGGNFTMHDGKISGNKGHWGAGVFNHSADAVFVMEGGEIFQNETYNFLGLWDGQPTDYPGLGGGVFNHQGLFNFRGGIIRNNTANEGGGVFNNRSQSIFNISGANTAIARNTAFYGGGLVNNFGLINIRNVQIYGNSGLLEAGGIDNQAGRIRIENGIIYGHPSFAGNELGNQGPGTTAALVNGVDINGVAATMLNGTFIGDNFVPDENHLDGRIFSTYFTIDVRSGELFSPNLTITLTDIPTEYLNDAAALWVEVMHHGELTWSIVDGGALRITSSTSWWRFHGNPMNWKFRLDIHEIEADEVVNPPVATYEFSRNLDKGHNVIPFSALGSPLSLIKMIQPGQVLPLTGFINSFEVPSQRRFSEYR